MVQVAQGQGYRVVPAWEFAQMKSWKSYRTHDKACLEGPHLVPVECIPHAWDTVFCNTHWSGLLPCLLIMESGGVVCSFFHLKSSMLQKVDGSPRFSLAAKGQRSEVSLWLWVTREEEEGYLHGLFFFLLLKRFFSDIMYFDYGFLFLYSSQLLHTSPLICTPFLSFIRKQTGLYGNIQYNMIW